MREAKRRQQETSWRKKHYDLLMNLIRKEGEGWGFFASSLAFKTEPRNNYPICGAREK